MLLLMVGIFAYREYRLTMYQDFKVHSETSETCLKFKDNNQTFTDCFNTLKSYRIYFKK